MVKVCIVPGCKNKSTDYPSESSVINFHPFPSEDEDLYQQWIDNIGLTSPPSKSAVVCSAHFTKDCFVEIKYSLNDDSIPYLVRLDEDDERMPCTSCTGSEFLDEKSTTRGCNEASQWFKGDISTQEAGVQTDMSKDCGTQTNFVKK